MGLGLRLVVVLGRGGAETRNIRIWVVVKIRVPFWVP